MGFCAVFFWIWQWNGVIFFVGQSIFALIGLEIQNYIGHYGLQRRRWPDGGYERVTPEHTWDSNFTLTNMVSFCLPRRPDHHANPALPCQALRHHEQSPRMPTGYIGMYILALVPPLWFRVMNPRVASFNRSRNQIQKNSGCEKALLPPHPSGDFNDAGRQAGQGNRRD